MKKYFYLILAVQLALVADETLFDGGDMKSGGFGGPSLKMMNINNEMMAISGGGGAWVINDSITIGSYGYGYGEQPLIDESKTYIKRIGNGFGGLIVGYNLPTISAFSPFASLLVGKGSKSYTDEFSIINIDFGVQVKLFKWLRVAPNIGYSIVSLEQGSTQKSSDFGGITYGLNFMFGKWNK